MDPCAINMMPGASMAAHIGLLHASIEAHAQESFLVLRSVHLDCSGPYPQLIRG